MENRKQTNKRTMNNYKTIETLRDIHDETGCPIIFIGMGLAHRKLERYKHLYDRFSEILKFETFGVNDIGLIINQLSEMYICTYLRCKCWSL